MEKETFHLKVLRRCTKVVESNFSKKKKIIDKNLINICPKTKNITYIAEITNWKNEKYLSEGRNSLPCSCAHLLASKYFFLSFSLSFIFLIWMEQFWIWFSRKLTKNVKFSIVFLFFYFYPLYDFWILVQTYQLII